MIDRAVVALAALSWGGVVVALLLIFGVIG